MSKSNKHETEREELKRRIDVLVDHYEKFGPPGAGAVIQVDCFVDDLLGFAHLDEEKRVHYRGRVLVPVARKQMSAREFNRRHASI